MILLFITLFLISISHAQVPVGLPAVINTWPFTVATEAAYEVWERNPRASALDVVELAGKTCQIHQCDHSVGWGGSPNEDGETTLDAMIMDGDTMDIGAVGCLKNIRDAIGVARKVMEHTEQTFLVGEDATNFALRMGYKNQSLTSDYSRQQYKNWLKNNCTPNYWQPPYRPLACPSDATPPKQKIPVGHDTIGVVAVNASGHVACSCTTNGLAYKLAGRVGDAPIPGAGAYCDSDVGGCAETGDGDVLVRFLPSFQGVELMRLGYDPWVAAQKALERIPKKYPKNQGAICCISKDGRFGAAQFGFSSFSFSLRNSQTNTTVVIPVNAINQ